jgi:hypothetical protein
VHVVSSKYSCCHTAILAVPEIGDYISDIYTNLFTSRYSRLSKCLTHHGNLAGESQARTCVDSRRAITRDKERFPTKAKDPVENVFTVLHNRRLSASICSNLFLENCSKPHPTLLYSLVLIDSREVQVHAIGLSRLF